VQYEYRHWVRDYNNIAPPHKTHSTNPVTRTWIKCNIQNYVQGLPRILCRADKSNLKIKILGIHTLHKNNDPRSAYAQHIPNCRHKYCNINDTTTLLKQINTPTLLLPYEQMYIQSFHHNNELILEQHFKEHNPMFNLLHSNTTRHKPPWRLTHNPTHSNQPSPNLCTRRPPIH